MSTIQRNLLPLLGFIASVSAANCPACYTQTVTGMRSCPAIPKPSPACGPVPMCILQKTVTIPGPNPACAHTPTVTTFAPCPTTVTCRKGCALQTKTVTGPAAACGVSWETGSSSPGSVSWDNDPLPASVSWDNDPLPASVSWDNDPLPGSVSWDSNPSSAAVSWDSGNPTSDVSWATFPASTQASVTWDPSSPPQGESSEPIDTVTPETTSVTTDAGTTTCLDSATQTPESSGDLSWDSPAPTNTGGITWNKEKRNPQDAQPSDSIGFGPDPVVTMTWGKRAPQELTFGGPSDTYGFHWPTDVPSDPFGLQPQPTQPSDAPAPTGYVSWGKRDAAGTTALSPSYQDSCPTVTVTQVPPCIPPICPHRKVPCEGQRVVEKTIIRIETVASTGTPVVSSGPGCTVTPTTTTYLGCPTYTCLPWGDCRGEGAVR